MEDRRLSLILRAREAFDHTTPLRRDCGAACEKRCCGGEGTLGMWLLPGEEALLGEGFTVFDGEDGQKVAVCGGICNRENRPFSCRIFPLFPQVLFDQNGRAHLRTIIDPRAERICPIAAGEIQTLPQFRRAVRRAGRILLQDDELRRWLLDSQDFLENISQLQERLENV